MSARLTRFFALLALLAMAGCALPDKPARPILYDFGPGTTAPATSANSRAPLMLADIESSGALDTSALLYRLVYADAHQLRPYAHARWSAPPPQLVRQRLREQLAKEGPVLDLGESAALARTGGVMPRILRIELEEFSHYFETPVQSWGLVRLRATLLDNTPAGERLVSQRSVVTRSPAPTPDASGGARALAAATDGAAEEISQWVAHQR
jgi:cholesterol transport system auxiliary component